MLKSSITSTSTPNRESDFDITRPQINLSPTIESVRLPTALPTTITTTQIYPQALRLPTQLPGQLPLSQPYFSPSSNVSVPTGQKYPPESYPNVLLTAPNVSQSVLTPNLLPVIPPASYENPNYHEIERVPISRVRYNNPSRIEKYGVKEEPIILRPTNRYNDAYAIYKDNSGREYYVPETAYERNLISRIKELEDEVANLTRNQ